MKIFSESKTQAVSRFWYYVSKQSKVKRTAGEILGVNEVFERFPLKVKNFGFAIRYNSRTGTHNMYKEIRAVTANKAADLIVRSDTSGGCTPITDAGPSAPRFSPR